MIKWISFVFLIGLMACNSGQKEQSNITEEATLLPLVIGTYTQKEGHVDGKAEGLYVYNFNTENGTLERVSTTTGVTNPSYVSSNGNKVLAVMEVDPGVVANFEWNPDTNKLIEVSRTATNGAHPCQVSISPSGTLAAVANYSSGNLSVYELNGDKLKFLWSAQHSGSSVVQSRQQAPHMHMATFNSIGSRLFGVDLGIDKIMVYDVNDTTGTPEYAINFPPGSGPRQLVFHPTDKWAYVVNELNGTVAKLERDNEAKFKYISSFDMMNQMPEDKDMGAADIQVTPDGKYVYASIRDTYNLITAFKVEENGDLIRIQEIDGGGKAARAIKLDPTGKFLLVPNQDSSNITTFEILPDGTLQPVANTVVPTPVSIAWLN